MIEKDNDFVIKNSNILKTQTFAAVRGHQIVMFRLSV